MSHLRVPVTNADHIQGPASAPLTFVEYGDYQCPFCGAAYPQVKKLQAQLGDDLRYVFRNFPLTQVHEFAMLGALAAEAADRQEKFWEMHDLLYENQERLGPDLVFELAQALKLDLERFQSDLNSDELATRIRNDFMGGVRSGVNGTPSYFLNDRKYEGALDADVFKELAGRMERERRPEAPPPP